MKIIRRIDLKKSLVKQKKKKIIEYNYKTLISKIDRINNLFRDRNF